MKNELKKEHLTERLARLIGPTMVDDLGSKHVVVAGLGGVGSWAAEAVARSFVGKMTIIDFDVVVPSNTNRQLVADHTTIGLAKVEVMKDRITNINPTINLLALNTRLADSNIPAIFQQIGPVDYVIDAIDDLAAKCALINYCFHQKIKLVVSVGAAGRFNPSEIRVTDLATTRVDRLGRAVRRRLREQYQFGPGPYGIKAICSREMHRDGIVWEENPPHQKDIPRGTMSFVTASFGMFCASVVVRELLGMNVATGMDA